MNKLITYSFKLYRLCMVFKASNMKLSHLAGNWRWEGIRDIFIKSWGNWVKKK